jgi:O-antigen/teichoic acid export membrane protein
MMSTFETPQNTDKPDTPVHRPSDHNLAASIGKNTFFGIIANLAQAGTRLVTVPIVITYLSLGGYGIWSIIMTAGAYMRFGSIGIKSAFQKYVAEATGNGDYETANKLLSTGCAAMLALSVAGLIPIAIFSRTLAKAAGVPPEFLKSTAGAISMLALIMVLSNVGAVFEAIVMGGHRIDIARKFTTFFTVAEAVAIVIVLHLGLGLFAMASVMAASEIGFIGVCFFASHRVVPQIRVRLAHVTTSVLHELFRFAGSYQLVNILEVLYGAILPVAVLRTFGAEASGVYAIATRLVGSALMVQDAMLLPILSGGTMVYASGSADRMAVLLTKAFKFTLALALLPLAFIGTYGTAIVFAWTGQTIASLRVALWFICLASLFKAFSLLGLVLYRVSGNAVMDNIRQALRIATLLFIAIFAHRLGFFGILAGLALTELIGMVFMWYAIAKTFRAFSLKALVPDSLKLIVATAAILAAGAVGFYLPVQAMSTNARLVALFQLGAVSFSCLLALVPALLLTRSVTATEGKTLLGAFFPGRTVAPNPPAPSRAE